MMENIKGFTHSL